MIKQVLVTTLLVTTGTTIHAAEILPHPLSLDSIQIALWSETHKKHVAAQEKEEKPATPKKDSCTALPALPSAQSE